jgi:2-polyprenyl-3-methyl-5-hydroxy-6-metoxy-1,4-benzoquinol methylase
MLLCNICGESSTHVEEAAVRSNVRKFGDTQFRIWRCPKCLSIHATDEVDLAEAYRDYPYHKVGKQDATRWFVNAGYRNQLRRLRRAGLRREHKLLDYGCGGGEFIGFLRERGYNASGYDEYSEAFNDRSALDTKYDLVLSQDVIEHVAEPWEHVRTLQSLVVPGGVVAIGTPSADVHDMRNPGLLHHALHQPYHRHLLSRRALLSVGERQGWTLLRLYTSIYAHTLVPFVNAHFFVFYLRTGDNTLDYAMEPLRLNNWKLYSLAGLYYALFGYFGVPEDNLMAIFRTSPTAALPRGAATPPFPAPLAREDHPAP